MELNGKCVKEFEGYINKRDDVDINQFNTSCDSMKFGILIDYFDSIKIHVDIHPLLDYNNEAYTNVISYIIIVIELNKKEELNREDLEVKTRKEARVQAILKACEVRNEQLNK